MLVLFSIITNFIFLLINHPTIVQSQNGNALSSSFLKASKIAILAIKSINPPIKENTADIINKLRTVKVYFENLLPFGIAKFYYMGNSY